MPHFKTGIAKAAYMETLRLIPKNELMLLDKDIPEFEGKMAVVQDFKHDVYGALISFKDSFEKYNEVVFIFPELSNHPIEIIEGVKNFCKRDNRQFKLILNALLATLSEGQAYIVIEEDDLVVLIKKIRASALIIGENIGIISFNETPLKDLLDITVISTDLN